MCRYKLKLVICEIEFNNEKYIILPHSSILMLIRDENLFD